MESSEVTGLSAAAFSPEGVRTINSESAKMKSFCRGASLVAVKRT
jgi:hypothetical protein